MPLVRSGALAIDYTDDGAGAPVILVHSSVSANRQWRAITDTLKDRYRVLAINLFGYGETTPWPPGTPQPLYAQAQLVRALAGTLEGPVHLVGHSFGGAVAMKAALLMGDRVASLALLEPNPFWLLAQAGRREAWLESRALRDHVKCYGTLGDWMAVAERFADYWLGDGAWAAMPEKRRTAFAASCPPNFHEWDAVMDEATPAGDFAEIRAPALVVCDPATRRPIREIAELLREACPAWGFASLPGGGHMAPLTKPELVAPVLRAFLDAR